MMRVAWNQTYAHPLPDGHRFPMLKYELIPEQLLYEGTLSERDIFSPDPLEPEQILTTHTEHYWNKLQLQQLNRREERRMGFPQSQALVAREVTIMGGTLACARHAVANRSVGLNVAGGTHHAYADHGEGFCLLNDLALTARILIDEGVVQKVLVVDLDVHQGNGTASIFAEDPEIFTFSIHGAANYPMHKEESDLDVPLADGCTDKPYLETLRNHLPKLMDAVEPELVLYQCGVDILETDKLGRLAISRKGCLERDEEVLGRCHLNRVPVVCTMGGGYSPEIRHIVEAHCGTFRTAARLWG